MDLFETLGLGPRQPEENELYVAIYADPEPDGYEGAADAHTTQEEESGGVQGRGLRHEGDGGSAGSSSSSGGGDAEDARLEALRARCTAWLLPYTSDYIWNRDPLVLRSSSRQPPPWERTRGRGARGGGAGGGGGGGGGGKTSSAAAAAAAGGGDSTSGGGGSEGCVWSVVRFGDAVDDEWWAVWLLLRMTRELQDLAVQVWDNDGQFLLIEAAYALPRWLKPETAEHRVWLRRGALHVLPLPSRAAPDLPPAPSRQQALDVLREGRYPTASPRIQRALEGRLSGYPAAARRQQQHVARCLLPGPLAGALRVAPQLVAELVAAFYCRDADDMRLACRMRLLPPSLERLPALVRMTRCHYAQLAQQRFAAPRGLSMPPPDSPLAKAADLGLKLTVAAEIICARYGSGTTGAPTAAAAGAASAAGGGPVGAAVGGAAAAGDPNAAGASTSGSAAAAGVEGGAVPGPGGEAAFARDPGWRRFKASLEGNGYFQGNIPGSKRHKELLSAAVAAFAAGLTGEGGDGDVAAGGPSAHVDPRRRLAQLVRAAAAGGLPAEDVAGSGAYAGAEDDDSWLDQQPERLQAELERRQAELQEHGSRRKNDDGANGEPSTSAGDACQEAKHTVQEVDADEIASKLRGFMQQLSGLEGVEMAGAVDTSGSAGCRSKDGGGVDFDPARFLQELEAVLGPGRPRRKEGGRDKDGDEEDEEEGTSSSGDEGSSFFSDEDDEDDEEEEEEDEGSDVAEQEAGGQVEEEDKAHVGGGTCRPAALPVQTQAQQPKHQQQPPAGAQTATAAATAGRPQAQSQPRPVLKRGFLSGGPVVDVSSSRKVPAQQQQQQPKPQATSAVPGPLDSSATATRPESKSGRPAVVQPLAASVVAAGPHGVRPPGDLRWEVGTATDSDDDEEGRMGSGEEDGHGSQDDDEDNTGDATARLMAALGIHDSSGEDGGSDSGVEAAAAGGAHTAGSRVAGEGGDMAAGVRAAPSRKPASMDAGRAAATTSQKGEGVAASTGAAASRKQGGGTAARKNAAHATGADGGFMEAYEAALQAELAGTTLTQSFEATSSSSSAAAAAASVPHAGAGVGAAAASPGAAVADAAAGPLQPVDLDMNLVRNLLRSYTAQQGTAGPAGNMAAMLGLSLVAGDVVEE